MTANPLLDSRDMRFVLFEMLEAQSLIKYERFGEFDRETFESVLDLAEQIAVEQVYPANTASDRTGARFDPATGTVTAPEVHGPALAAFNAAGFTGIGSDPRWGGVGMPDVIYRAVMEYFFAAGISFTMNISLLVGATNLVKTFISARTGRHPEKDDSRRVGGTMC